MNSQLAPSLTLLKMSRYGMIGLLIGVGLTLISWIQGEGKGILYSYLVAHLFWTTLAWGALFFLLIHHLTNSVWSLAIRRLWENTAAVIPILGFLFLPVIVLNNLIYPWSDPHHIEAHRHLWEKKAVYLNPTFFTIRTVLYWVVLSFLALKLRAISLKQDTNPHEVSHRRFVKLAAPGMIAYAIVVSFAAFDWLMSLEWEWYSTIYGVYIAMGGCVAGMAFMTLMVYFVQNRSLIPFIRPASLYPDIGKLLFTFVILWAYMAFSQYFLIWYANLPEETQFYHHRWVGNWRWVSLALVFGHFVIPFFTLISHPAKRNPRLLAIVATGLLIMHYVDLYWNALPVLDRHNPHFRWSDLGMWVMIGGVFIGRLGKLSAQFPLYPKGEPSLTFSSQKS